MINEEIISIDKIMTDIENRLIHLKQFFLKYSGESILMIYIIIIVADNTITKIPPTTEITSHNPCKETYMVFAWLIALMSISIIL